MLHLIVPRVLSYLANCESQGGIRVKYSFQNVLTVLRKGFWQFVLSFYDFLVELFSVLVLERKVATDHRVKDHTARPNISSQSVILLASDHFGSSVAGTPTSRFQLFPFFV